MQVTVALDARYSVTPDGSVWTQVGMARQFWERYLDVFDAVRIVARAARVDRVPDNWLPVTSKDIHLCPLPDFSGPWQCLKRYPALRSAIRSAAPARGAVILRVGSQIANMLERPLLRREHPYAVEVVGDPYEVFAPGVVDHPLRPFFRWHFSRQLRRQCMRAVGAAYVTRRALQERYPAEPLSIAISDVELPQGAIRNAPFATSYSSIELDQTGVAEKQRAVKTSGTRVLVTVGSLAQLYKGTDVLIEAAARCVGAGLDINVLVVGDGKYRTQLMEQAERAGVSARIQFLGQVTAGEPVRRILDDADLFVLPSRTEGLPRAMVEAMARGLPCIGSAVGGIPELLDANDLVPSGDPEALAAKIQEVLANPSRMEAMSRQNLAQAQEFRDTVLAQRRRYFYEYVRYRTARWEQSTEI